MAAPYNMIPPTPSAAALERPVAVLGPQFCMPHPIDLSLTSKKWSFTGADFTVTDVNGNIVFKVEGRAFRLLDNCSIMDSTGKVTVKMRGKLATVHRRWNTFSGESTDAKDKLFSTKKSSFFQMTGTKLDVFLAGNTSEDVPDFKVKGSYTDGTCTIYLGETDTIIAQTSRHHTIKSGLPGKRTFCITVYPQVDYAFIISLVLVFSRQIYADRQARKLLSLGLKNLSNMLG